MEIRFQHIFLKICTIVVLTQCIVLNAKANEQTVEQTPVIKVEVEQRQVIEDILDNENFEIGLQVGAISIEDFETNLWLSGHVAYHISEYFYAKALYGQAKAGTTSFEKLANVPPLLTDEERKLTYYGLNIGYNVMPGEVFLTKNFAFNSIFSIELGAGSTKFTGDNKFTVNGTANYRVFLTDWITWDIAMSDYVFETKVTGEAKVTHNLNFSTGFAFYF
jgi:outer membrane beta-barrel protein